MKALFDSGGHLQCLHTRMSATYPPLATSLPRLSPSWTHRSRSCRTTWTDRGALITRHAICATEAHSLPEEATAPAGGLLFLSVWPGGTGSGGSGHVECAISAATPHPRPGHRGCVCRHQAGGAGSVGPVVTVTKLHGARLLASVPNPPIATTAPQLGGTLSGAWPAVLECLDRGRRLHVVRSQPNPELPADRVTGRGQVDARCG